MKQFISLLFFVAFSFVYSPHLHAQVTRLYTTQQGLKTNNCHSIEIDSRGLVWVSGSDMLGLFDGTRFQYLPNTSEDGHKLFQTAYGVTEMAEEQYWVYSSHGLFRLDARNMVFNRISLGESEDSVYGYATNAVIDYPKKDCKMVTTDGYGSFVLNGKTLEVDEKLSARLNEMIGDLFVEIPLIDKRQQLWATTKGTPLVCLDLKTFKRRTLNYTPQAAAIMGRSKVTALLEAPLGMLIGTSHGILIYDVKQNLVREMNIGTADLFISSIIRTRNERTLVGTDGRGIWEYKKNDAGETTFAPLSGQTAEFDITFGKVMDMEEDQEGNVVAIFLQKGLAVIPPQEDCFHYHAITPLANEKNATCVTSMAIDQHENYWVATDGCGIFTTNGMFLATAHPLNEGLRSLLIQDVKIDKHGTVWAGSFGGGVQYLENGRWTDGWLGELSQELVMTMFYDAKEDQMLVGTNGNGIYCLDIPRQKVQKVELPFVYNPWVCGLLKDSEGTLWVATSNGIVYYDSKTKKHGSVTLNGERISNANALQQDGDDILIACDTGLLIYHKKTGEQELIAKGAGLSCEDIHSITLDKNTIWLATRTNIASVDKKTHEVRNYSSFSGYQIGEFHRNSFVKPGHGYILFGGDNGIICFQPQLISNRNKEVKTVYFTSFNTPFHTEYLDANIFYAKQIELNHDNSSFTISFSAVELGDPERIHYDYLLEGLDQHWLVDAPSPSATYSSLPPGDYTLRVRAYLEDNPDKYAESSIHISVAAPWYASPWAFIFYTLILLGIAYYIYQQIQNRKRQKEQLRLSAEQDRMKEAKLKLFTSITHELRSPLTMIESPLKQLMLQDPDEEHQNLYGVMRRNCDRLLDIVKQITDIRKIDAGQLTLHMQECDYVEYSDQVFEQFKGIATVKNITFDIEHNEAELLMMMDTSHFEKIITNILSNAFKFTPEEGKIVASSGLVGNHVELRFYNSGSHFNEEDLSHLWERFYQGSAGDGGAAGSGIGLNLVYELTKLHHGTIEARNVEPEGVEFILHFPYYNLPTSQVLKSAASSKPTILLVDDDQEMINYIGKQLERDFNVIAAFSGNTGWKKVMSQRPDVVVTDYRMPDGNGMELCQFIKSNPETENIPIIMLTGEGDEMLQLHSLNTQVDHYLEKPVNIMLLRSAISQVLRVRESLWNKARRTEIAGEMPIPVMENADDKLFSRVNEAIKKHLDDSEFSVQQLSDEVGISRVHLNRKMKERYGVSPNIFIKSFRLKQAAYLLVHNNVNVSEVAYKVGFSSHSYFTTSFHDYFGMSPKEFILYYSEDEHKEALAKLLE
ncbi:MAG: response regulator [Bacteroidaceae bacterium]|nr:response regulator [Bacteroidaceae bacterium]